MQPQRFALLLLATVLCSGEDAAELAQMKEKVDRLEKSMSQVTRQLILQQFAAEEQLRNNGNSGIKQIRLKKGGLKSYFSNAETGNSFAAIHDHANNIRTVGMGEFIGVLNGFEFRTRHNDYRLKKAHSTDPTFHATENVEFPEVPPEVLNQATVEDQEKEMREWFKAWRDSDHSVRDYRKYFRPLLCYLEGAWLTKQGDSLEEPFESDRHFVDADGWFDLQERIRVTSYTGSKSLLENLAYLPTTITRIEDGTPVFAQWNYRILCHPVKAEIPLNMLRADESLATRMKNKYTFESYENSRAARFMLNTSPSGNFKFQPTKYCFLDKLMEEIPGKNNYAGSLEDEGFDAEVMDMDGKTKKDVSRYHRWFKLKEKDAMGNQENQRGFGDQFLFAAKTDQSRVAGLRINLCKGKGKNKVCNLREEKWSYAIPLEIIYLTPLNRWNPYKIPYQAKCNDPGRSGSCSDSTKSFTHTCERNYYQTPAGFFTGTEVDVDNADTTKGSLCFLDPEGTRRGVKASGTRIMLPNIEGVGRLRTRFPIAPIHGEGTAVWKHVDALRDLIMNPKTYGFMGYVGPTGESTQEGGTTVPDKQRYFEMAYSDNPDLVPQHTHKFQMLDSQAKKLMQGWKNFITLTTEQEQGHTHTLQIRYSQSKKKFVYRKCAGKKGMCMDRHPVEMTETQE